MYQVCTGDCPIRSGVLHNSSWKDYRMKLLADENIPASVVRLLEEDGYDIRWIRIDSPGISDIEVMRNAHQEKRVILTYDKDFGELAVKVPIYPSSGIILIRLS